MLVDIHSHILHAVDDGATDINESIGMLEIMKEQGVTDVIATPHFYADIIGLEEFLNTCDTAFSELNEKIKGTDLPRIHKGCEVLYFENIGISDAAEKLTLAGSRYLLLELCDGCIGPRFFCDMEDLMYNSDIIPIIAHIERYHNFSKYKQLLDFVEHENIPTQINASSLFINSYKRPLLKLVKRNLITFLGSDAHSTTARPPRIDKAISIISERYGEEYSNKLLENSKILMETICKTKDI